GGLPVPYRADEESIDVGAYKGLWQGVRRDLEQAVGHPLSLETEPGRYLVCESGYLVAEGRAVKRMGENLFYLVDAGFTELVRAVMDGAYHEISLCPKGGRVSPERRKAAVAGPLCESGDVFTQREGGYLELRELPEARVGDYLVFHNTGAYGASMGS